MRRMRALLLLLAAAPALAGIEVEVRGLKGEEEDNVKLRLGIVNAAGRSDLDDNLVQRLHQRANDDIRSALQPFGYYSPQIDGDLSGSAPDWRAVYQVQPGPVTEVRKVEVLVEGEGAGMEELKPALKRLQRREGKPLDHALYEEAKATLLSSAIGLGFLDARYTRAELRVYPEEQHADVALTLDTGARWYFGAVALEAQRLDPELVQRYVQILEGQPFESRLLLDTQFALADLEYFDDIEIEPQRDKAVARHIPVRIYTTLRKRAHYDLGLGYGTDTGARISAGAEFRRLNRRGHKVRADLRLSQIKNTFGAEYRIPLGRRAGEQLSFTAGAASEQFEDGDSKKYSVGAGLSRILGDWQRRIYLQFEHEKSRLGADLETSDLLMPGLALNRSRLDDPIHTRSGWAVFADLHGAHRNALSTASFLQVRTVARVAVPVPFERRARLLGRVEYGASLVDEFSELPASQRFFAGGDQSVRGYKYQSIGPRDAQGRVIGGKYLSTYSLELDYPVWHNWGAALFYDAGGAGDDPGPKLFQGAGVGLRYRAPVGFVRVDVAQPLDGDGSVRLHLGVSVGL
ncbi:MAG TPA: autotransporter assembly complex family protein [Solimonas sp.]|nr:autotransporter assembly complex family protein [Solimonas sp.]